MDQLHTLQSQLQTLRTAFDNDIRQGKSFSDVKNVHMQIKDVEKKLYELKIVLKRQGHLQEEKFAGQ